MARSKAELEEILSEAEAVIEQAAEAIEAGDIHGAKSALDGYLSEKDEEGPTPDDE